MALSMAACTINYLATRKIQNISRHQTKRFNSHRSFNVQILLYGAEAWTKITERIYDRFVDLLRNV